MSFLEPNTLKLLSRNEGKIKSYESCFDIRAWSHDSSARDRYLKEWIKCDMPYGFVPLNAVICILRTMSCRNRGRAAPRCHLECKSKVILDSICSSCHAMKHCLRNDEKFEKYFVEEELETSHWPCERCLEALKSIKMFWRIIIDKVFNINVSKNMYKDESCSPTNSVRDVAKMWQRDLLQQACLVKAINEKQSCCSIKDEYCKHHGSGRINKMCSEGDGGSLLLHKASKCSINSNECRCKKCDPNKCESIRKMRQGRRTSVRVKTCEASCNTSIKSGGEELSTCKNNLEHHKKSFDEQCVKVKKLKKENCALKMELENMRNSCKWKLPLERDKPNAIIPKPFECCLEENESCPSSVKPIESEMVITLKNCKNSNFKHVSLLQVLHKTNQPLYVETCLESRSQDKEDPIELLTKVQTTLGAIFRREMFITSDKQQGDSSNSEIEATFKNVTPTTKSLSCCSSSLSPQCHSTCFLN